MKNITTQEILTELKYFYKIKEISDLTEVSTQTISNILRKNTKANSETDRKIRDFFDIHVANYSIEMTIPEMVDDNTQYLVESPDGWIKVSDYMVKPEQPCLRVIADDYSVECSGKHFIQLDNTQWIWARELKIGDNILTKSGTTPVSKIETLEDQKVYDIQVDSENHRYWSGGISSHNSFKSGFIQQILANAQKKGLKVVIFDTENALTTSGAETLGLDVSQVIHIPSTTVEGTRNAIYKFLTWVSEKKMEGKFIIAIDSIANLQSEMELTRMDKESVSADMGSFAKSIKSLLKTCINMSTITQTTIIISNHVHDNPAQMFPSIEQNISGGKAAAYLPTVTVQLARKLVADDGGKTVDSKLAAGQKKYSGVVIRALTVKNRLIQQYLEGEMYLSFASGLNKYFGLLEIMKGLGVVEGKGSVYYDWEGNKLGFYKAFRNDTDLWDNRLIPEFDARIAKEWIYGSGKEQVVDFTEFEEDEETPVVEEVLVVEESALDKLKNLKKKVTQTLDEADQSSSSN